MPIDIQHIIVTTINGGIINITIHTQKSHYDKHHNSAQHKVSLNLGEGLDLLNLGLDVGDMGLLGRESLDKLGREEVMSGRGRMLTGKRSFDLEGRAGERGGDGGAGGRRKPQGRR